METNISDGPRDNSIKAILIVAGLIVFGLGIAYFFSSDKAEDKTNEMARYFREQILTLAVANTGHPIGTFDADLLLEVYPGLVATDFSGVDTVAGRYQIRGDTLTFIRDQVKPVSIAEKTISDKGYLTLLENVSVRLRTPRDSVLAIDALIASLKTSVRFEVRINQGGSALGVTILPFQVLEDSRCPRDVTCIQAGTVRLRVDLTSGLGRSEQVFILGQPITTEAEEVTLEEVSPVRYATKQIDPNDYVFTFSVKKRADVSGASVPIQSWFPNKIVYISDQNVDKEALQRHCALQGGTFNECGSPCAPGAETCIAVCVFTCELPK